MIKQHEQRVRKFNPGTFQSDREIVEQFVVRQRELAIVLDVLRGNIHSPSCQHMLVVAPRGRGKSMLLARVAAELRIDDNFRTQLFPLRFMEESQEIFNIADFWLEALFYLASQLAKTHPELSLQLHATHQDLVEQWQDSQLDSRARAAVLDAADRIGRKLVLMVENMQSLCEDTGDNFGWQLRKALQSETQIMLLATATSRFEGLDKVDQPFYELFRQIDLHPLDTEECRRLWEVVSGDRVSGREIKPLQILTGGSPRLLVIIADFARHRSLRQLMEELVTLIDDHTEYFRGHLESFAKTERRVYLAVIDLWQPSRTGEIAARARMDVRTVSTLLGRLVKRGAVVVEGTGNRKLYSAAERLYSIYYKLRRERDEAAVVSNLVRFMTVFYSGSEFTELSGRLIAEAAHSTSIHKGIEQVVAELPEVRSIFPGEFFINASTTSSERVKSTTPRKESYVEKSNAVAINDIEDAIALVNKGITQGQQGEPEAEVVTYDMVVERFSDSDDPELLVQVARALVNKGITQGQHGELEAALVTCDEVVERYSDSDDRELLVKVAEALVIMGTIHLMIRNSEGALITSERIERQFGTLVDDEAVNFGWRAKCIKMNSLIALGKQEEALQELQAVFTSFIPENKAMMRAVQIEVPALIAAGALPSSVLEVLLTDKDKYSTIAPLVVALRQENGETVRAPAEVLEVAADIRQQIAARRQLLATNATGNSVG